MRLLVVGSGGREHALCRALAASPLVEELLSAPGNAGIARDATCVPVAAGDVEGLVALARERRVDLVVVGPELPLVRGLVDRLAEAGIAAVGPTAAAAHLEGSKAFTKAFCARHGIPTAAHAVFGRKDRRAAERYVRERGAPIVIKADGLAAGKGVVVAETVEEALEALEAMYDGAFGGAGALVVIEERLMGREASLFALTDGSTVVGLGTAEDHKRAFEGDQGPNTGGMGAYAPSPLLMPALTDRVMAEIVRPTIAGMAAEGHPFRGILYAGLMMTESGPKLLEYNVRFGDPEAQAVLPLLDTDLAQLLQAAASGTLEEADVRWRGEHAVTVVLASAGYPGSHATGSEIRGIDAAEATGALVFHAGTALQGGRLVSAGGRVLNVTATAPTLALARERAYAAVARIDWPDGVYRRDIGARALEGR